MQKFAADGAYLTQGGSYGPGAPYSNPYRVAVGPDGSVYVAEWRNNRVQKFTADGTFVTQWGSPGSGPGQMDGPMGVAVGADGLVYVAEYSPNRVQVFTGDGTCLTQWGSAGDGAAQFYGIYDLATGPQGSVYVVDYGNYRVQKFAVRIPQVLTFTSAPPADARVGGSYLVSVTGGGSGNPVVLTVDAAAAAVCSIAGSTVSFVGAGTCIVNAKQAGNDRYTPAPQVQQSFTVAAAPPPVAVTRTDPPLAGCDSGAFRAKVTTNSRGVALRRFTARKSGAWNVRYAGSPAFLPDSASDRVKVRD